MATGTGGGRLAVIAATKLRVDKTRKLLGLSGQGIQKPLTGPPPQGPAATNTPPPAVVATAGPAPTTPTGPQTTHDPALLGRVRDFLAQQQGQTAAAPQGADVISPPAAPSPPIEQALQAASAQNEPIETQYFRLAGRPGSPQELAVFATRIQLEKELGRPPTAPEIRGRLLGSAIQSPALPVALELPANQAPQ
jgi:hypothetical protein